MQQLELEVCETCASTPLIRTLRLRAPAGAALPPFSPGAHLQVSIPDSGDPRCYSLVNFSTDQADFERPALYRLGVRLEERSKGGSAHMHALRAGDRLRARGPINDFPLHPAEEGEGPVVLIAGGIGITPIASMAAALRRSGRPFVLHYSGRSRDQLAFIDELSELAAQALIVHADDEADTRLDLGTLLDALDTRQHLYTCGPKGMIDAVIEGARTRGWPPERIHFELFATAAPMSGDRSFEIELRQSGKVLTVPADMTILDVLEAEGLDPLFDCKRGECGVCQAVVLEGEPDHRDYYLSDAEKADGKLIQICISRSKSPRLVLDL